MSGTDAVRGDTVAAVPPADVAAALRRYRGLAHELARHPDVVATLLEQHVDAGDGRCAVCRRQQCPPLWPCALATMAAAAHQLLPPVPTITCPRCRRRSAHPVDVAEGYCGSCHDQTSPPAAPA